MDMNCTERTEGYAELACYGVGNSFPIQHRRRYEHERVVEEDGSGLMIVMFSTPESYTASNRHYNGWNMEFVLKGVSKWCC